MAFWLAMDLAVNTQDWTIAYFHHPPYSKGSHDSDNPSDSGGRMQAMRENFLPILEGFGVDLVLSGHSHAYERSVLLDHHYGTLNTLDPSTMILDPGDGDADGDGAYTKEEFGHRGAVYTVAGSSGQTGGGTLDHPVMTVSLAVLGSLVLDIENDHLTGTFLDDQGQSLDHFQLIKDLSGIFADGFETGTTQRWTPATLR